MLLCISSKRDRLVAEKLSSAQDPRRILLQEKAPVIVSVDLVQIVPDLGHVGASLIGAVGVARHTGDQIILKQNLRRLCARGTESPEQAASVDLDPAALFQPLIDKLRRILYAEIPLRVGETAEGDLAEKLTALGYERTAVTEVAGQFSIRGEILDLFPPGSEYPYRLDFFDTEVESIRTFDPMTQRSNSTVDSVTVSPAILLEPEDQEHLSCLWDYLDGDALIAADDWDRLCEARDLADRDWASAAAAGTINGNKIENFTDMQSAAQAFSERRTLVTTPFLKKPAYLDRQAALVEVHSMAPPAFGGRMDLYGEELRHLLKENYHIHVACSDENRTRNLKDFANRAEISGRIEYDPGSLPAGVYFTDDREAFLSDRDIFRSAKKK